MRKLASIGVALLLALGGSAMAQDAPDAAALVQQHNCMSCHAVDQGKVGPAFGWIAYRYHSSPDELHRLALKVIHGGDGDWDAWTYSTPMPPYPQLSDAQAQAMVEWILARAPVQPPNPQ